MILPVSVDLFVYCPLCSDESGMHVSMTGVCVEGMFVIDIHVYSSLCSDESGMHVSMTGVCVEGMFVIDIHVYSSLSHSLLLSPLPHPPPMHLCIIDTEKNKSAGPATLPLLD